MGIKITSVSEALDGNGIKILIHGLAGSGKTVFTATTGVKTLIISAESGLLSIADAPDYIHTTVVKTIYELEQVYDYLVINPDNYKVGALDSISEIAETLLADEKKNSKDPRAAYGNLSDRMLSILRGFRDLPIDIIMSCKQVRIEDPDTNVTRYVPSLPGKSLTNSIGYLFDEVFALRVEKDEDGEDYRTIQTGRDRNYEAKDRSGVLEMFEEPSAKKIFDKIRSAMPEKEVAEEIVEEIAEEIVESYEDGYVSLKDPSLEENIGIGDQELEEERNKVDGQNNEGDKIGGDCPNEFDNDQDDEKLKELEKAESKTRDVKTEDEKGNIIENETDKTIYLYHNTSGSVLKLPPRDYIDDDGNIEIINFKTFVEHSKRLKAEAEKE